MSLTIWTFSLLAASLGHPEWCSSSTLFLPRLNSASQLVTTLYTGGIVAQCNKHITMNCFARHFFKEQVFYNCEFFKFIHIYIIFYHSEYHLLNFVISQCQNNVNCINNYVNELPFSYCNEFNLYPKFPSEAGNFWNNPSMVNSAFLWFFFAVFESVAVNSVYKLQFFYIYVKYDQWNFGYRLVNIWNSSPKWVISANTTNTFETRLEKFSGTVAGTKSYSELLLLFLQARIQPTLDPCTEAFLWQAHCTNPRGEESGWRRVS